ncbi:MAG: SH3 domain-containing protein [Bacteroidota bacterium]
MKPFRPLLVLLFSFFLFTSCGDSESSTSQSEEASTDTQTQSREVAPEAQAAQTDEIQLGICLWPEAGLRSNPGRGKDAKWMALMNFGEVVTLTGKSEESGDRNYLEMELSDGKVGWCYEYLFAVNAQRAAATNTVDIYTRPDLTTFDGKQFERGEIFAVVEESPNEGWLQVFGKEKKKKGWVKENTSYSTDEVDVNVAIMYSRALLEKNPISQSEKLENITKSSLFGESPLMSIVNEKLDELKALTELPANQLMVTAKDLNVRSEPNTDSKDNIVFKLQSGDICNVLERGNRAEIRNMNDFWYLIEKDGQEGWVYGYFTSKKQDEGN